MFLIAGAKVRTFPLPAKLSDDFFSGRKHKRARKELGENTLGKEKNHGRETGGGTGGKRAAERAGSGGGRHTLLLWRAEGLVCDLQRSQSVDLQWFIAQRP